MFPHLQQSIKVGYTTFSNRMAVLPTQKCLTNLDGYATPEAVEAYRVLGDGGWGLVIVEITVVHPKGMIFEYGMHLFEDTHITGHRQIAEAIHQGGTAKAVCQLLHGGRSAARSARMVLGGVRLAPSVVLEGPPGIGMEALVPARVECKEMTEEEIQEAIEGFVSASVRAKSAGYDGVEVHAANGVQLVHQFMSPWFNRRQDRWGQDRAAFAIEVIRRIRRVVGPEFIVAIRVNASDLLPEGMGLTLEEMQSWVPRFEEAGIDYLNVIAGTVFNPEHVVPPIYQPRGVTAELIGQIKQVTRVPVIGGGKINDPILAEKLVAEGKMDIAGFSRQALADPDFARKTVEGRSGDIRRCIYCDIGCGEIFFMTRVRCSVNYACGRLPQDYELSPARTPGRVMVVGGGVAGMEAARVLALRNHRVALYEKSDHLGGNVLDLAGNMPRVNTHDVNSSVDYLCGQLHQFQVPVQMGVEVTPQLVDEVQPDVVVLATGSQPFIPDVPGVQERGVITLDDYLKGKPEVGNTVIVWGGDYGSEVALSLARQGKVVTLVSEKDEVARTPYMPQPATAVRQGLLLRHLDEANVNIKRRCQVKQIVPGGMVVQSDNREETLEANTVIVALRRQPLDHLFQGLVAKGIPVYKVGDCVEPKNILESVHTAYRVARQIEKPTGPAVYSVR
ncbi:MAG: FAD-dependent oxidoreductase [Dehalococcoidia bacterium]|nr:FAD-dependent oxidoreductase [Dehalococcoidia bacterium]